MPRVSVIIAARNATGTLADTLASVAAQTVEDWEVVVVDDGSTDDTGDLALRALPGRVRVVRNEVARGPSLARNAGASAAQGELLAILDADDRWVPTFLETQLDAYDQATAAGTRVGLIGCDAYLVGSDGSSRGCWSDVVGWADPVTTSTLLRANTIFSGVVVPAAVFAQFGGYDADLPPAEDYDLWLRIAESEHAVLVTHEPLSYYRISSTSLSADTGKLAASTERACARALARGHLTAAERRLARQQIRLQRLVAQRAQVAERRAAGSLALGRRLRLLPGTLRVAAEHPERWATWARARGTRAAGTERHA